ncbi:MAG: family ATPase [Gammaproteobacteria bacterium]|jgi:hypothetical protein|nr:family ATPase [Gammaproteobacteria bacterium]
MRYLALMLTLAPHLEPGFLGRLIAAHLPEGGEFPEFGGVKGATHRGILPTGETAQFVAAGGDLEKRLSDRVGRVRKLENPGRGRGQPFSDGCSSNPSASKRH